MIRSKGEAGTGNIVEAVRHMREIIAGIKRLAQLGPEELAGAAKEHQAPLEVVREVAAAGRLPVPLFCAGGIATPADAALMMQLGAEGNFVGSGIFKSADPERRARAIVEATTHFNDPERVAAASTELGEAMPGLEIAELAAADALLQDRGWPERRRCAVGVLAMPGRTSKPTWRCCARSGAEAREVRVPGGPRASSTGWSSPAARARRSRWGSSRRGLEPAIRAHHDAGRPVLGTCAGMIVCDAEHLGLIDATRPPQRVRPPAAELRGRPRDRGDRRRAAARGLHPRSLDRAPRPRRRGARRATTATRWRSAQGGVLACAFHPELTDDPRLHALFMAMTTGGARARPARRRSSEGPSGGEPGEDPGRLLDQGEGGRGRLDRRRERRRAAAHGVYEEVLKAGRPPDPQHVASRARRPTYFKHASDEQLDWVSPVAEWMVENADVRIAIGAEHQHARALRRCRPSARPGARRRRAS